MIRSFGSRVLRSVGLQRRKSAGSRSGKRVKAVIARAASDPAAQALLDADDFVMLEQLMQTRLRSDPADPLALALMGKSRLMLNDPAAPVGYYAKAEACGGFSVELRREYARALDLSGQTETARRQLLAAMRAWPETGSFSGTMPR